MLNNAMHFQKQLGKLLFAAINMTYGDDDDDDDDDYVYECKLLI